MRSAMPKGVHTQICRLFIEAIVFRLRTGCPWRDLHERFGPWHAIWNRQRHWAKKGWMGDMLNAIRSNIAPDLESASLDSTCVKLDIGAHGSLRPIDGSKKGKRKAKAEAAGTRRCTPS